MSEKIITVVVVSRADGSLERIEVLADVVDIWAIHALGAKLARVWNLTHIPSGLAVVQDHPSFEQLEILRRDLLKLPFSPHSTKSSGFAWEQWCHSLVPTVAWWREHHAPTKVLRAELTSAFLPPRYWPPPEPPREDGDT